MHLLLIEDNPDLVDNLYDFFDSRGHTVDIAYNGPSGLKFAQQKHFDAIILDLMLPGMDGLEVCAQFRAGGGDTPLLMLTARDTLDDKLDGFAQGADDYLVKPFALPELEARLSALVRRHRKETAPQVLRVHDLSFDTARLHIERAGRRIELAPIPLRIFTVLMRRSPGVVSRKELEHELWGDNPPDSDSLRAHIHALRSAIDRDSEIALVHTVRGIGYQLAGPHEH